MGILSNLLGFDAIIKGILGIINKFIPDKDLQQKIEYEIRMYQVTSDFQNAMKQIEVNVAEAKSGDKFASRWRPFIGWVCGGAFLYHVIVVPLILFIAGAINHPIPLPQFDQNLLNTVMYGMLGLGGFRTFEKLKGIK